jgi:hypothetical protein
LDNGVDKAWVNASGLACSIDGPIEIAIARYRDICGDCLYKLSDSIGGGFKGGTEK